MNEENTTSQIQFSGIIRFLDIVARWKKFILIIVLVVTFLAAGISFLLPRWYKGSATILPPKNQNPLGNLSSLTTALGRQLNPLRALSSVSTSPELYNYLSILKSRTLLEMVVTKYDLIRRYEVSNNSMDAAVRILFNNVTFKVNEEGTLIVEVLDREAERAAEMTNYIVSLLDQINQEMSSSEASGIREFIGKRVSQNLSDLKKSEEALKEFQKKSGFVGITETDNSAVEGIANLYALKIKKELEIGVQSKTLGNDNPTLKSARLELSEIESKLKSIPDEGVQYLRLYREFAVQQKLYEILFPLYEQSKVDEQRDTPTLLILDKAKIPDRPVYPKKMIIVVVFFSLSLIVSLGIAFYSESLEQMKKLKPEEYDHLRKILNSIFRWK
jgi:uncharacterized protein involved in exopolysaccharide biosynthesis